MGDDIDIRVVDPRHDSDADIARVVAFTNVIKAEWFPDDPPNEVAEAIAAHRARPARQRRWSVRASVPGPDGPRIVGIGGCSIDPEHDDNPDTLDLAVHVDPDFRGRGIGRRLFAALVDVAAAEHRPRLFVNTMAIVPAGAAMAAAAGGEVKQAHHINHLLVADVDRAMLESWVAEATERAPGYELIAFDGRCPDEHVEGMISQILVLNTAPRDDVEINDFTLTVDQVREHEAIVEAAGEEVWTLLARETATGAYAGMHDVAWRPTHPELVWVGLTGVEPAHRGHAIGKWLKATMMLRVMDERPHVTEVRTGNADSNDAMLGINARMGYKPLSGGTTWEIPLAAARAWVERASSTA